MRSVCVSLISCPTLEKIHQMGEQMNEWTISSGGSFQLVIGLGLRRFKNSPCRTRQVCAGNWQWREIRNKTRLGSENCLLLSIQELLYPTLYMKVVLVLECTPNPSMLCCPQIWAQWTGSSSTSAPFADSSAPVEELLAKVITASRFPECSCFHIKNTGSPIHIGAGLPLLSLFLTPVLKG